MLPLKKLINKYDMTQTLIYVPYKYIRQDLQFNQDHVEEINCILQNEFPWIYSSKIKLYIEDYIEWFTEENVQFIQELYVTYILGVDCISKLVNNSDEMT